MSDDQVDVVFVDPGRRASLAFPGVAAADGPTRWDDALDQLYSASPREFVLVRARLERELRADGDDEHATEIRRRRPPQLAAWACNQLARTEGNSVAELVKVTQAIAQAQSALGAHGDADELRRLTRDRNALLERLAEDAVRSLRGLTPKPETHRSTIANTLDAASANLHVAPELGAGHLTQTLVAPSGFGPLPGPVSSAAPREPSQKDLDKARREVIDFGRRADDLRSAADAAAAELTSAQLEVETTRAHVNEIRDALRRADDLAAAATQDADAARQRAEAAHADARRAQLAFEDAQAHLAALESDR
jgi:hypothetical protein